MRQVGFAQQPLHASRPERFELIGATWGFGAEGVHPAGARQRVCVIAGMRLWYEAYSTH